MRVSLIVVAASVALGGFSAASATEFGRRSAAYPLYERIPYSYARTGFAAIVPCRYPDGWNAGDASQSLRGVPGGIDHHCRVNAAGTVIDRDGDPTE